MPKASRKKPFASLRPAVQLIASGDLRLSANQTCWPAQHAMETALGEALAAEGFDLVRSHPYKEDEKHGFIASQREGIEVFRSIDPDAPLIVAEAVWQYSHHVLAGLTTHRGPILTVANWSGQWPGLVGMLNLNGSLTKAGVRYSTLWSLDFTDAFFKSKLRQWLKTGKVTHDLSHVKKLDKVKVPAQSAKLGAHLGQELRSQKAILGIFDEGCMGMFNAIIPDHALHACGVFKERLSQSSLFYETMKTPDDEAHAVLAWLEKKGMKFHFGKDHATELTREQVLLQCKMYIAALRIADDFGCDSIGIQYQQGLKDLLPASDLVEGTLNNADRPPVTSRDGTHVLYKGEPLVHFNEVDECAGLDGLMTCRVHQALGQPVESTLHDVRWGEQYGDDYVWVLLISGAAPPAHFIKGWKGADGHRQPTMYFPNGGSTLRGVSKPGEIVWSRIYVENETLHMDIGRGGVVELPKAETERRWQATTPQWPIMHAVTYGVSRDQLMAKHKANHIQVAYANDAKAADHCLFTKAAFARELGIKVNVCGSRTRTKGW
ncbi:L-fucose isomerase-like protein [Roseimicrobium gellanilyticum]|uniref:L-fucose isomerase-like protein n=1 Tax=Roseimicrobium gellanilyticum TaxID=748857 RepID=A0A366HQY6_9BACT|nr:L-fucose/L-arabinose isomerase family protein [Roseimicrobium gellanilyticum]RBP46075.1 L-fucose isomerase-like protein [Roseimicrobium gellanilyticum]